MSEEIRELYFRVLKNGWKIDSCIERHGQYWILLEYGWYLRNIILGQREYR